MSGGVDSSVAAALLKKSDFAVQGLFVFFTHSNQTKASHTSAQKVADILNIKLNTLDLSKNFEKEIIQDFISAYKSGNTPNPCIRCNKYFKFGKLLDYAQEKSFDYLATGHYSRIVAPAFRPDSSQPKLGATKKYKLITARDKTKDQSYFLYNLTQDILPHILFPLGNYLKSEVKKMAKKMNLPVHASKESSDVCFIPNQNTQKFLQEKILAQSGDILNTSGEKIGTHTGLPFYTLGQRQGINIGGTGPYYVISKNFKDNTLIVTNDKNDPKLYSKKIIVKDIHWFSGQEPKLPLKCLAQHRYQSKLFRVEIIKEKNNYVDIYVVKTKKPQRAITPGQSIVFYKPLRRFFNSDFEVLGGGIIN